MKTSHSQATAQTHFDVVIIGGGVAGALIACKMRAAKKSVVILDAGPRIDRVDAVNRFKASPTKGNNSPYPVNGYAPDPDDQNPQNFYVQAGPVPFTALYMKQLGGTTWHMTGHAERFQPDDFELKKKYGVGADWPLTYTDLEKYYQEAENLWGVAGQVGKTIEAPRLTNYPMPPILGSYLDAQVAIAAGKCGYTVLPYPHARNTEFRDNRPACCGNANCNAICPIGAKYDAGVHITQAEADGAVVMPMSVVNRILLERQGNAVRVAGVSYLSADGGGAGGTITGKTYVLAAHAIESPKLLLQSRDTELAPNGVANSSGQVGRNLLCTIDLTTTATAPAPLYPYRGPVSATSGLTNFRNGPNRDTVAAFATFILNGYTNPRLGPINQAATLIGGARKLLGRSLRDAVATATNHQIALNSAVEVVAGPDNKNFVEPSDTLDLLGQPYPKVYFDIDTYTANGVTQATTVHHQILTAMGATNITTGAAGVGGAIIAGTARMGATAADSVVNDWCQSWDHDNLFIVGNANFPTVSIASPSLTNAALALRAAERIAALLGPTKA